METVKHADHYNRNLECPACGKKSRFKIWDRIQIDKNPGLRDKVRDLSLFRFQCPKCGHETYLDYDFLYIQSDLRLVIYYAPGGGDVTNMHQSLQKPEYEFMKAFRYRLIRQRTQLLEKLAIFDAGYDDRVIEIMKVMIQSFLVAQASPIHASLIEFTHSESGDAFHFADQSQQKSGMLPFNDSMRQTYQALERDLGEALPPDDMLEITPQWAVSFVKDHQDLFA